MRWSLQLNRVLLGAFVTVATAGGAACHATEKTDTPTVAVSIAPHAWLVGQICGPSARVITLVPSGQSPHSYQPTDQQVSDVMRASLYVRAGVPFERGPWFRAITTSNRLTVVDMRTGVALRELVHHTHDDDHAHPNGLEKDPHIWLDPTLLMQQARTVTTALQARFPQHAVDYAGRLDQLLDRLTKLDAELRERLAPFKDRAVFVFHPAWGYFCDAYGLRQLAVEVEGKEPTDSELTGLQRLARREGIRVVFVQPQITSRSAAAVANTIGGTVAVADPLHEDVIENLQRFSRSVVSSFE